MSNSISNALNSSPFLIYDPAAGKKSVEEKAVEELFDEVELSTLCDSLLSFTSSPTFRELLIDAKVLPDGLVRGLDDEALAWLETPANLLGFIKYIKSLTVPLDGFRELLIDAKVLPDELVRGLDEKALAWLRTPANLLGFIKYILNKGIVDISPPDILHGVCDKGELGIALEMLEDNTSMDLCINKWDKDGKGVLFYVFSSVVKPCCSAELLLPPGPDLEKEILNFPILREALISISNGLISEKSLDKRKESIAALTQCLIKKGIKIDVPLSKDSNNGVALHLASGFGLTKAVKLLLDAGAKVNVRDSNNQTPLHVAVEGGNLQIIKLLLDAGTDPDPDAPLLLQVPFAFEDEDWRKVDQRPAIKADVINARDKNSVTPLHIAVKKGDFEIVMLLLEAEANVNVRDSNNQTPLHIAVAGDEREVVRLLLERKANVNARDKNSVTPLHIAVKEINWGTAVQLLNAGADVNARDKDNQTPLDLLNNQAPLDKAKEAFKTRMVELLKLWHALTGSEIDQMSSIQRIYHNLLVVIRISFTLAANFIQKIHRFFTPVVFSLRPAQEV